jgi:predicted metalloprotease with PDZ domain
MFGGGGFGSWRRGSDYYQEGELIWLEVANIIYAQSHGQKTFEDFFRVFYGGPNNGPEVNAYTFEDLVRTFNSVVPYDWARFFNERLNSTSPDAPLGGIETGGWKLVYDNRPEQGGGRRGPGLTYSLGLSLGADGSVQDSIVGGPAYQAGVTSGMKVIGVNGRMYTADILSDAISAAKSSGRAIELLVVNDDYYKTCSITYREGEKYPHLVRDAEKPDYLQEILKPLRKEN